MPRLENRLISGLVLLGAVSLPGCSGDDGVVGPQAEVAQVSFIVQPSDAVAGQSIAPPLLVMLQDAAGNVVATAADPVTLTIADNPGAGTLLGTTAVDAANGVAVFDAVAIDKAGEGYTLEASLGLISGTSASFDIQPSGPAQLAFLDAPPSAEKRTVITPAVRVEVQDVYGNRVVQGGHEVTIQLDDNPGEMFFHASGNTVGERVLQLVDPLTPEVLPALPNSQASEVNGLVYDPVAGDVIAISIGSKLSRIDPQSGLETFVGNLNIFDLKPLALEGGPGGRLLTASPLGRDFYELDPTTATATYLGDVTIASDTVTGFNGLATDPTDGTIYGVVQLLSNGNRKIRNLVSLDVGTLIAINIGTLSENGVAGLAFLDDGTLYCVTGDGADNPETLWQVDKATAGLTQTVVMGDGDDGEAIATIPASLSGTLTLTTVNGIATFSDLQINASAAGYSLLATAAALTSATSASFDITP
jgi:hypothetical protein